MISSQKTPSSTINISTGVLLGVFLGAFLLSFVMWGIGAFIIALLGGVGYFFVIRSVRMIDPTMRGAALGLLMGNLAGLIVLGWVALKLNLSINLWAAAVFVLTLGILRTFVPNTILARWLKKLFPWLILNGIRE